MRTIYLLLLAATVAAASAEASPISRLRFGDANLSTPKECALDMSIGFIPTRRERILDNLEAAARHRLAPVDVRGNVATAVQERGDKSVVTAVEYGITGVAEVLGQCNLAVACAGLDLLDALEDYSTALAVGGDTSGVGAFDPAALGIRLDPQRTNATRHSLGAFARTVVIDGDDALYSVPHTASMTVTCPMTAMVSEMINQAVVIADSGFFCPPGQGLVTGSTVNDHCAACLAGFWSEVTDGTPCKPVTRASSCTQYEDYIPSPGTRADARCKVVRCAPGHWMVSEGVCGPHADLCAAGEFESTPPNMFRNRKCTMCAHGKTSAAGDRTPSACQECAAGSYSKDGDACTKCNAGRSSVTGSWGCGVCTPGQFAASRGSPTCDHCDPGRFAKGTAASACAACHPNTYSGLGASGCTACGLGTDAPLAGTKCTLCAVGHARGFGGVACAACVPGRHAGTAGSSVCLTCLAGTAAPLGAANCTSCANNTFAASAGEGACAACPAGQLSQVGGTQCNACAPGKYGSFEKYISRPVNSSLSWTEHTPKPAPPQTWAPNCIACHRLSFTAIRTQPTCDHCRAGMAQSTKKADACTVCNQGTFSRAGSPYCLTCEAGQVSGAGAEFCVECAPGKFNAQPGAGTCNMCAAGRTSVAAATACTDCRAGTFAKEGWQECVACGAGQTSAHAAGTCVSCAIGKVRPADSKQVSCTACRNGYTSHKPFLTCVACPHGYRGVAGRCLACAPGKTSPPGSDICVDCAAGQFAATAASPSCTACKASTYAAASGSRTCEACAAGTISGGSAAECTSCATGKYAQLAIACSSCDVGKYVDADRTDCDACAAGTYGDNNTPTGTSAHCVACAQGSHSEAGETTCEPCAKGKFGAGGQTSAEEHCHDCKTGRFAASTGTTACVSCDAGKFGRGDKDSSQHCVACAAGSVSEEASSSCKRCGKGKFALPTKTRCVQCLKGQYQDKAGSTTCRACLPGTYGAGSQSSATYCKACALGQYQNTAAQLTCIACTPGRFGAGPQVSSGYCTKCAAGSFTAAAKMTACTTCTVGKYQDLPGRTMCHTSPVCAWRPGRYQQWIRVEASASVARVCEDVTLCKGSEYEEHPPTKTSDRWCRVHMNCPTGHYEVVPALRHLDAVCVAHRKPCAAGSYETVVPTKFNDRECKPCAIGHFKDHSGAAQCKACGPGQYQDRSGRSECRHCGVHEFAPSHGQSGCSQHRTCNSKTQWQKAAPSRSSDRACAAIDICTKSEYEAKAPSASSDRECSTIGTCSSGEYQTRAYTKTSDRRCAALTPACVPGKYESVTRTATRNRVCTACASGQVQPKLAQRTCTACAAGTYQQGSQRLACVKCATGKFSATARATACAPCTAGKVQPATGKSSCSACTVGKSQPALGKTSCTTCVLGRFGAPGASSCRACASGTFAKAVGASKCDAWHTCPVGWLQKVAPTPYSDRTCFLDECPQGQFEYSKSPRVCRAWAVCKATQWESKAPTKDWDRVCAAHTTCPQSQIQKSAPTKTADRKCGSAGPSCSAGKYVRAKATKFSPQVCGTCPVGKYAAKANASACDMCPKGTVGNAAGAKSAKDCSKCPNGYFPHQAKESEPFTCAPVKGHKLREVQQAIGLDKATLSKVKQATLDALKEAAKQKLKTDLPAELHDAVDAVAEGDAAGAKAAIEKGALDMAKKALVDEGMPEEFTPVLDAVQQRDAAGAKEAVGQALFQLAGAQMEAAGLPSHCIDTVNELFLLHDNAAAKTASKNCAAHLAAAGVVGFANSGGNRRRLGGLGPLFQQFVGDDAKEVGLLFEAAANGPAQRELFKERLVKFVAGALGRVGVNAHLVQGAVKLWEGKLPEGLLEVMKGTFEVITPSLRKAGVPESLIQGLQKGDLGWVKVEGDTATFSVANLPEPIRRYLEVVGLSTIAVEMKSDSSGVQSVAVGFEAGPADLVDGIMIEGGSKIGIKFEDTGKKTPAPANGVIWKVELTAGGTLAIAAGTSPVRLALSASYAYDKTVTPNNKFTLAGACGQAGVTNCATDMLGVRGFGISHVSVSTAFSYQTKKITFTSLSFAGGVRLGSHVQSFSGDFARKQDKTWQMTFLLPALNPTKFVDFARRVGSNTGPDWLKDLPTPPAGQLGFAFTNVVGSKRPTWKPCTTCAQRDLSPGITISADKLGLPNSMVDRFESLEFLRGVRGSAYGTLAVGFAGAKVSDSQVNFKVDGTMDLVALKIKKMSAYFTGGSTAPKVGGTLGFSLVLPEPASSTIDVDDVTMSYKFNTKELRVSTSFYAHFRDYLPSGTLNFVMVKSPVEKSFTCSIPKAISGIPFCKLSGASIQYKAVRASKSKAWGKASWSVGMKVQPELSGFPQLVAKVSYDPKCMSGSLGAEKTFWVWGVAVSQVALQVKKCKSTGTELSLGGRLGINGKALKNMVLAGSDAMVGRQAWRPDLATALDDTIGTMPLIYFDLKLSYKSQVVEFEVAIPLDANKKVIEDVLGLTIAAEDVKGAKLAVVFVASKPKPDVKVVVALPSMGMVVGNNRETTVHFTALEISVEGIIPRSPAIVARWGFWVQFSDMDGNCCSLLGPEDSNGVRAILPDGLYDSVTRKRQSYKTMGYNPQAVFTISADLNPIGMSLTLQAYMKSADWFEDFLGIPQLGVKGLGLMVKFNLATQQIVAFGMGATMCLYRGKPGQRDNVEANKVVGGVLAGKFNPTDPQDNCFYFSTENLRFSKVIGYVLGLPNFSIPSVLDVNIIKMMYGWSTSLTATKCMGQGQAMTAGIMWDLQASWLGFSVRYMMEFFLPEGAILPRFKFELSITNSGFITDLKNSIKTRVLSFTAAFVAACKVFGFPIAQICEAAQWLIDKLFTFLIDGLFSLFGFTHFIVKVPDVTQIFNGGDWPSFALKFKLLGITFDLNLNLGKLIGSIGAILVKGLKAAGAFFSKCMQGIKNWFSTIASKFHLNIKSCENWSCLVKDYHSCKQVFCGCKTANYAKDWTPTCSICPYTACRSSFHSCNRWSHFQDVWPCLICGRRRLGEVIPLGEKDFKFGGPTQPFSPSQARRLAAEKAGNTVPRLPGPPVQVQQRPPQPPVADAATAFDEAAAPHASDSTMSTFDAQVAEELTAPAKATRPDVRPGRARAPLQVDESDLQELQMLVAEELTAPAKATRPDARPGRATAPLLFESDLEGMMVRRSSGKPGGDATALRSALAQKFGDSRRRFGDSRRRFSDARRRFGDSRRRFGDSRRRRYCTLCRSAWSLSCEERQYKTSGWCPCSSCRHISFLCADWKSCQGIVCGVKNYNTCRTPACGIDFYIS